MSLQVGKPWHCFMKLCEHIPFIRHTGYIKIGGQGQLQNDTQGASRDSVSEFKGTVPVLPDTEVCLILPSCYCENVFY